MRILITNDDGIESEGIRALVDWARNYGEVYVFAPNVEQSGKSHAIDFINPMEITKESFPCAMDAYRVDSTPADCVRFAILGLHEKPDLVISGINLLFHIV